MGFNISTKKILSASNIKRIIALGISLRDELSNMELGLISDYDNTKTYTRGQAVYYNNYLYKCLYTTTGDFDESKWQLIGDNLSLITKQDIEAMINLSDEDIKTLQSLILDTSIELSHVWSSSKTYGEIQNAIKKGEAFTLSKLASTMTASFEVATSISDIKEGNILYLLNTGTNTYDIYALIGGNPTVIASTTIDLSQYAKLSDLNNYYDKATSDGKYATITTVDGKVDKTSILSTISSTPSDDKLLSEKAIKTELDKKAGIDKISHVSKYVCADSPIINDTMYRLYIGNDNVRFQKFIDFATSNRKVEWDYALFNKDYGLFYQALGEGKDLNDLHMNCFFATSGKCLNIPDIDKNFFGISLCYGGANTYSTQICVHANENQNTTKQRTIYVRHCYNGTWGNWGTISSTSVADVGTTTIKPTFPSTITLGTSQRIQYSIKNGWANVSIAIQLKASPKLDWTTIATGLPKSDKQVNTLSFGETSVNNASIGFRLVTNGILEMKIGSEITQSDWWYINITYPVAE